MKSIGPESRILILENIRSAQNVGSLFRTADAVGIDTIYLVGITAKPIDRFGRKDTKVTKASLGSEDSVYWEHVANTTPLLDTLKQSKVQIISIEQSPSSVDYKNITIKTPVAFILGNEVGGVSGEALALSDIIVEIPMKGMKESFNVSVAGGIALARMLNI